MVFSFIIISMYISREMMIFVFKKMLHMHINYGKNLNDNRSACFYSGGSENDHCRPGTRICSLSDRHFSG